MSREVTLDATGPRFLDADDVDPEKGDVAVCQCGLSDEFPFCDGSHRATEDEAPDERYKYVDGERRVVAAIELADGERLVPGDTDEGAGTDRATGDASDDADGLIGDDTDDPATDD
jgi:CDGSH-type Zn-finger protein